MKKITNFSHFHHNFFSELVAMDSGIVPLEHSNKHSQNPKDCPILRECSQYMYAFIQSVLDWFVPLFVHKYTEEWKVWPPSLSVPPERKRGTCAFPVWCGGWEVLGNAEPFFSFASSSLHCRAPLFFPVIILHLTDHPPSHSLNHSSLSLSNFVKSAS